MTAPSAAFFQPSSHLDALVALASAALEAGDGRQAWAYADRRRRLVVPTARDLLTCAEAARLDRRPDDALRELAGALSADPIDAAVNRALLAWGPAEGRNDAERRLLEAYSPRGDGPPAALPVGTSPGPDDAQITVVVPVYADLEATRACLESLRRQRAQVLIRVVVVDDASPDPAIAALLDAGAKNGDFNLVRNHRNLGFVGAVTAALPLCAGSDVLLLNADTALPPGAVERLRQAVHSRPDIGTATPLSNNGEYTSFPKPFVPNPMPSADGIAATDAICARVNTGLTTALPSGVGFCLYIRRDCFEAIGPLSQLYAPGYGEDIEFCLAARERGFVNVCAADVFVGHVGSLSFAARKRAYVMRGLGIVEDRFPGYRLESAALLLADPLASARAAIEREAPPAGPVRLIVAGSAGAVAAATARATRLAAERPGLTILTLKLAKSREALEIRAVGEGAPQSLSFGLDAEGLAGLVSFIGVLELDRIELADPVSLSEEAVAALLSIAAPMVLLASDFGWHEPGADPERQRRLTMLWARAAAIVPLDPVAAAFAARHATGLPIEAPPSASPRRALATAAPPVLALLAPFAIAALDRLTIALGRALSVSRSRASVLVIGECLDDLRVMAGGNVVITGPAGTVEYPQILAERRVTAILSPYRGGHAWLLDAAQADLPAACFDPSAGAWTPAPGDLALDPGLSDAGAARRVMDWLLGIGDLVDRAA